MNSLDQAEGECGGPERAQSCLFGAPGAAGSAPGLPERAASSLRSGPRRGAARRGAKRPREASAPSPLRSRGRRSSSAQTGELGRGVWGHLRIPRLGGGPLVLSGRPAGSESGARREGLCRGAPCAGPPAAFLPWGVGFPCRRPFAGRRLDFMRVKIRLGRGNCPAHGFLRETRFLGF